MTQGSLVNNNWTTHVGLCQKSLISLSDLTVFSVVCETLVAVCISTGPVL